MILSLILLAALQTSAIMSKPETAVTDATPTKTDLPLSVRITNAERSSVTITSLDLDMHLVPAEARIEVHASIKLRNTSPDPITRIPLQISSTLNWSAFSILTQNGLEAVPFIQAPIATDTDHTGYAQEAVLSPSKPLTPGASLIVSAFYTGQIPQSAARLELIGVDPVQAVLTDWDQISSDETALRGFGNVLWFPVAAPTALLGDTNRLFQLIAQNRHEQAASLFHLRLTVEYVGEGPNAVSLNGRTLLFEKTNDTQDSLAAETHGLATAEFLPAPLGFRSPNLFFTASSPVVTDERHLSILSPHSEIIEPLTRAAALAQPLLVQWLGPTHLEPLTIIDHRGQTFEDGALLVTAVDPSVKLERITPQLVHGFTHARIHSSYPWIDEGLAQFMVLLWTERMEGREAVVAHLQQDANVIAFAEPDLTAKPSAAGQPLIDADEEVYFRTKAAAVWWQLRGIVGDETLQRAIQAYVHSQMLNPAFDHDPKAFEHTLEHVAERDLAWYFNDWVYRDRGLPDLSIAGVSARPLPVGPGKDPGFLVAIEVRNDGDAVAEVPVTVRSGTLTASQRLRIGGHASASTRIVFQGNPDAVQVNDGTTPEVASPLHTRPIKTQP